MHIVFVCVCVCVCVCVITMQHVFAGVSDLLELKLTEHVYTDGTE